MFPVAHDRHYAWRWPFATLGLILLNVVLWLGTCHSLPDDAAEAEQKQQIALTFVAEHPEVTPCPGFTPERVAEAKQARRAGARVAWLTAPSTDDPDAQARQLCREAAKASKKSLAHQYGYVPAAPRAVALVTHAFLHSSIWHLALNLWFLWLAAVALEDVWGRAAFPAFYLLAAAAGAIAHHLSAPGSGVPLIGASGAVSGVIGAFLVCHPRAKIQVATLGRYSGARIVPMPAYLLLPLWALVELFGAFTATRGDTAYWAHLGGFCFGGLVATLLKSTGLEARLEARLAATRGFDSPTRSSPSAPQTTSGGWGASLTIPGSDTRGASSAASRSKPSAPSTPDDAQTRDLPRPSRPK
ncbi:MAG: rhomboid family intramembrane serine protease [Polyangiaceae bacterium]|nr:rhomboid family intramembrane serine protease [Polyangiaceae bacterium]MCW5789952.1 rhomboid family intramembrane serine protease [Polyangiaceae bacterium]